MRVAELWRFPVKSMGGERLEAAEIGPLGLKWDRGWAVRDEEAGVFRNGRHIPELLLCAARYLPGTSASEVPHVAITLPDGATMNSDDSRIDARLSDVLGRRITLWSRRRVEDSEHLRRKPRDPDEAERDRRRVLGLSALDPIPDLTMPPTVRERHQAYVMPPGTFLDGFMLTLLAASSIRCLRGLVPEAEMDMRRFRMNVLVDDGDHDGPGDLAWLGATARIGTARVDVLKACVRCIITGLPQPGLAKDPRIFHALRRRLNHVFGVNCEIRQPGVVRLGDEVRIEPLEEFTP